MITQEAEIAALKLLITHIMANLAMNEGTRSAAQDYIKNTNDHMQKILGQARSVSPPERHKLIEDMQIIINQIMSGYDFSRLPE